MESREKKFLRSLRNFYDNSEVRHCSIITGTNSGLGKALFDALIEQNDFIISISRSFLDYQYDYQQIQKAVLIKKDLSNLVSPQSDLNLKKIISDNSIGSITFYNNAATLGPTGLIGEMDNWEIHNSISVNYLSPILIINYILSINVLNKIRIVNITSGAATSAVVGWPLYCSNKSGMKMFCNVLKDQEANSNVSVFQIDPGLVDTKIQLEIRKLDERDFPNVLNFREEFEKGRLKDSNKAANEIINLLNGI